MNEYKRGKKKEQTKKRRKNNDSKDENNDAKKNIPVIYYRERNINYIGKDDMYDTNDILNDMKMQMYDAFSFFV